MSDTTPAPTVEPVVAPLVAPDLSAANIASATTAVAGLEAVVKPFISYKVRAILYTLGGIAGAAGIAAVAVGGLVGGTVGHDLETVGSVGAVVTAVLGLSHISK